MAKKVKSEKRKIEQYDHKGKTRANNPPVGLVTPKTDPDLGKKTYQYDPHLDPQLQWAGKAERLSFEVPTVSLHVHERIDPRTIVRAVQKRNGDSTPHTPCAVGGVTGPVTDTGGSSHGVQRVQESAHGEAVIFSESPWSNQGENRYLSLRR